MTSGPLVVIYTAESVRRNSVWHVDVAALESDTAKIVECARKEMEARNGR